MKISFLGCVAGLALILGTTTLHAQGANNGADLKSLLSGADKDGDGVLSQSEMTALYDLVQGRTTGRTNLPGILRPGSTRTNAGTVRTPPTAPPRTPVPVPPPATQPVPAQTNRAPVVRLPKSIPQTKPAEEAGEQYGAITSEREYEAEKRRLEKDYESAKKDLERNYEAAKRDLERQWEDSKDDRRDKPGRGDERGKGKGKGKAKGWDKDRD